MKPGAKTARPHRQTRHSRTAFVRRRTRSCLPNGGGATAYVLEQAEQKREVHGAEIHRQSENPVRPTSLFSQITDICAGVKAALHRYENAEHRLFDKEQA